MRAGVAQGLAGLVVAATMASAMATGLHRWSDANNSGHYGDHGDHRSGPSTGQAAGASDFVEPGAIAGLRIEAQGSGYYAWADNRLAGPIEVMLHYRRRHNAGSDPALPARAIVPAGGSTVVAVIQADDAGRPFEFELRMDSLPGHPSAAPVDVDYLLPLASDGARIDQGYGGTFSHDDAENLYAVDFAVPVGTPVLAARGGVVMQVQDGHAHTGLDRGAYAGRANFVRLLHPDGAMSLYAHLQPGGVLVRPGQPVAAGQRIGLSGNTGFTTGPHLHFVVQVNRGMRLVSLPFRMPGIASPEP